MIPSHSTRLFGGPLSPVPEITLAFIIGLIISVVFLIRNISKRKHGENVSIAGPIVATVIFAHLILGGAFITYVGYGIMTSM